MEFLAWTETCQSNIEYLVLFYLFIIVTCNVQYTNEIRSRNTTLARSEGLISHS